RIALGRAQEPGPAQGLHTADRSPGTQLGQEPVALDGEVGVAKVKDRQRIEAGRDGVVHASRHVFPPSTPTASSKNTTADVSHFEAPLSLPTPSGGLSGGQATPAKQGTDREHSRGGQSQSRSRRRPPL